MKRLFLVAVAASVLCFAPQVFCQKLLKGIDIGGQPGTPAVNTITNMIYIPNSGLNTLTVISGSSGGIVTDIPVGPGPLAAAVNPTTNLVYVSTSSAIDVIDGSSNTVATTVPVSSPGSIAVNSATNLVYFLSGASDVSVLNGSTNQIDGTVHVGLACCSQGIAVNSTTNRVYVSERPFLSESELVVINGSTNKFVSFELPGVSSPGAPVVDSQLNRVYISDDSLGGLYVINGSTVTVLEEVLPTYHGPVALGSTSHNIADFDFPLGVPGLSFFGAQGFVQVGVTVNFPQRQSPSSIVAGTSNRYYVTFSDNNSIAVITGPESAPPSGTRRRK
jgi:DNA-binding beta-propeller fold protein YncE